MSSVTFDFICTKNTDYTLLSKFVDTYVTSQKGKYKNNPKLKNKYKIIIK
jgi:hypothetical protein